MTSFNEIENIVKTLPVGYYIKRNVDVSLDKTTSTSYYDPMNDKICISAQQVALGIANATDSNSEEVIRTVVYHEVSHAFLTPKILRVTSIMNVFEDERIESILRSYYMNVNFKNVIKAINNYHGENPKDAFQAFYHLVRFRVGERKWLNKVHNLIIKYCNINASATDTWCYENDVERLYEDFTKDWNDKQTQQQIDNNLNDISDTNSNDSSNNNSNNSNNDTQSNNEDNKKENTQNNQTQNTNEKKDEAQTEAQTNASNVDNNDNTNDANTTNKQSKKTEASQEQLDSEEFNKQVAESMFKKITSKYADENLSNSINLILQRISKTNSRNGSAINAHSGVFDVRSTMRDDYKFFVQKNRLGHVKAFSKTHLNLFIDRSGSFKKSQEIVNRLLYALAKFEKANPDFSFTLITCGVGERIEPDNKRKLECDGGTCLDEKIFEIYDKVQAKGQDNYNIVLFDGDAFYSVAEFRKERYYKHFGAFNSSNTTIISDDSNSMAINRYAPSARKIFTVKYADTLVKNVLDALQMLGR